MLGSSPGSTGAETPALDGIRVLDAGQLLAGPFAASLLADYGADVIKIERPGSEGDPIRSAAGIGWLTEGRNKRLITLDIRSVQGRRILFDLIKVSDVIIENFRPGTFARLGFSDAEVWKVNPGIIIAHASGYGQVGPLAQRGAFDRAAVAYSGVGAVTGYEESPPTKVGVDMADYMAGWHTALQILVALRHREKTGQAQAIDTALFEAPFRMTREMITEHSIDGSIPRRFGNQHRSVAPGDAYLTRDGHWIAISCGNDAAWQSIARAIKRPELQDSSDFGTNAARVAHREAVNNLVAEWIASADLIDVVAAMEQEGVAVARYNSMADIAKEEQFRAVGAILEYEHEDYGPILLPGIVGRLSATPGQVRWLGRDIGADNEEVYCSLLGMSKNNLDLLSSERII